MILLDLAEEMQLSQHKLNLLNEAIHEQRIAAQPKDLDKLQVQWAEEMVRFHELTESFKEEKGV